MQGLKLIGACKREDELATVFANNDDNPLITQDTMMYADKIIQMNEEHYPEVGTEHVMRR